MKSNQVSVPVRGEILKNFAENMLLCIGRFKEFDQYILDHLLADLVELKSQDYSEPFFKVFKMSIREMIQLFRWITLDWRIDVEGSFDSSKVFFFSRKRKDQKSKFRTLYQICDAPKSWVEPSLVRKNKSNTNLTALFVDCFRLIKSTVRIYSVLTVNHKRLYSALYLVLRYQKLLLLNKKIAFNAAISQAKSITLFMDYVGEDSLVRDFAKRKGIPTICVQHGMPLQLDKNNWSVSNVLLKYSKADHWLVWGEISAQRHIDATQLEPCRFHALGSLENFNSDIRLKPNNIKYSPAKRIVICLSQRRWNVQNKAMIEIGIEASSHLGLEVQVKLHPSLNYRDMKRLSLNNKIIFEHFSLKNIDTDTIGLCYHSTIYYEWLVRGARCLRYKDDLFDQFPGLNDCITNSEDAIFKLKSLNNISCYEAFLSEATIISKEFYGVDVDSSENYRKFYAKSLICNAPV